MTSDGAAPPRAYAGPVGRESGALPASGTALVRRARRVNRRLAEVYPAARCALEFDGPWELLVATILSAQCTDVKVNQITPALFARYPDPAAFAEADPAEVEAVIRPIGLHRAKARAIVGAAQAVCSDFGGEVPDTMRDLVRLPGVGRKTANVVLGNAFGVPGIAVDTHVSRLSRRLGWTERSDPDQIEQDLMALFPRSEWVPVTHRLIAHGRMRCHARRPLCESCEVARWCPSEGTADRATSGVGGEAS